MGGQPMSGGKFRMKASVLSFRAAVVMVVAGHDLGYRDGHHRRSFHVSGPCTSQPARLGVAISVRHLLSSASANRPRPLLQAWIWIAATAFLTVGVGLVYSGYTIGKPIAVLGSLVILGDMLLFAWIVYRLERKGLPVQPSTVAAE